MFQVKKNNVVIARLILIIIRSEDFTFTIALWVAQIVAVALNIVIVIHRSI